MSTRVTIASHGEFRGEPGEWHLYEDCATERAIEGLHLDIVPNAVGHSQYGEFSIEAMSRGGWQVHLRLPPSLCDAIALAQTELSGRAASAMEGVLTAAFNRDDSTLGGVALDQYEVASISGLIELLRGKTRP